jgi:hypothetical protein
MMTTEKCKTIEFWHQISLHFTMIFKFIHLQKKFIFAKNLPYFWWLKPNSTKVISPLGIAGKNLVKRPGMAEGLKIWGGEW